MLLSLSLSRPPPLPETRALHILLIRSAQQRAATAGARVDKAGAKAPMDAADGSRRLS